jgi:ketosteroid isomerase-like protein
MIVVASARITQRLPMQSARFVHASVIVCAVAVNDADKSLLRTIWTEGSDVSFVYPRGRLQSWKELESYWDAFLRANFSKRHLEPTNVAIRVEGNVAWVVFDWEFTATRTDGRPHKAQGWETQVFLRSDRGWRIAHVQISRTARRAQTPKTGVSENTGAKAADPQKLRSAAGRAETHYLC